MAEEGLHLRDYQKSILDRLEAVKNTDSASDMNHLGVEIGGKRVMVSLDEVSETLPIADIQKIPLVKSWFLGVANLRGILYSVNDLKQLLGDGFTEITSNTRLVLVNDVVSMNAAFLVDRLIGLRSLGAMKVNKQKNKNSVYLKTETYEDDEKNIWYVLDSNKLMSSKELASPYAA